MADDTPVKKTSAELLEEYRRAEDNARFEAEEIQRRANQAGFPKDYASAHYEATLEHRWRRGRRD